MSAARKPRLVADPTAAALDQHLRECSDKHDAVNQRLENLETAMTNLTTNVADLTGQLKIVVGVFVREKPQGDGSTLPVFHVPKPSLKAVLSILGAFGGIVLFLQFLFTVSGPALRAGAEWIMQYGR